jgi:hypothetical protein
MKKERLAGINVAISTVDRPKHYLHKVVRSLGEGLPVRLIVGSPSYDYLKRYKENSRIEIIGVDPGEWAKFKNYTIRRRSSWNYWRCFVHGVRPGNRKGLLILEDDVIPAKGWEEMFLKTIKQIEAEYGEEYILSLYAASNEIPRNGTAGDGYTRYPSHQFGGTQAMYYPEPVRIAFSAYMQREAVETWRMPYDWLLKEYLCFTGTSIFATVPCLFEHIGDISSTGNTIYHQAGYFKKAVSNARQK